MIFLLMLAISTVDGFPKYVNPCGIPYDQLGSEKFRYHQSRRALISRINELVPLLNATYPDEFKGYPLDAEAWIPQNVTTIQSNNFMMQLVEINRSLKIFSCALDIIEKDYPKIVADCNFVTRFTQVIKQHRLLVCETDVAMGILDVKTGPDYPTATVEVPNDWVSLAPDCTQKGFLLHVVYTKYKCILETFLKILRATQ